MSETSPVMSMTQAQIINKILSTKSISIIQDNAFTREYFPAYVDEMLFIVNHYKNYGAVPDTITFLSNFPDFQLFEVTESDKYLSEVLSEEYTYTKTAHIVQQAANLIQNNAFDGVNYLNSELSKLSVTGGVVGTDIVSKAKDRYDTYVDRKTNIDNWYISTGFPELDAVLDGIKLKEEFIVLFARTGQGKSFVLTKMLESCWEMGKNVGYISPEMSAEAVGYRFDSAYKHFNCNNLNYGREEDGYSDYISDLTQTKNSFVVATPTDFNNSITVSKIRSFISKYKIDVLGIDGLSYMQDETRGRNDNRQQELTNISAQLFNLSLEIGVPIIAVVQANRSGATDANGELELEHIRDADGIAHSATKVISIRHKYEVGNIVFKINKNRMNRTGDKFTYRWSPQTGEFFFIPSEANDDSTTDDAASIQAKKISNAKQSFDDNPANVF